MDLGDVANLWFVRPEIACRIAVILKDELDVPVAWNPRHPPRSASRGCTIYYRRTDGDRIREFVRGDRVSYRTLLGDGEPTWSRWRPIEHRWEIENAEFPAWDFWDLLAYHEIQ